VTFRGKLKEGVVASYKHLSRQTPLFPEAPQNSGWRDGFSFKTFLDFGVASMSKRFHNDSKIVPEDLREKQRIEELRATGLFLIRTRGRLVKEGNYQRLLIRRGNFTIEHFTPFNQPAPQIFRGPKILSDHWTGIYRYGLTISQGRLDVLILRWDNEQEVVTLSFREEFEDPWDVRFLKYALKPKKWTL
jgi:hypothetical protein